MSRLAFVIRLVGLLTIAFAVTGLTLGALGGRSPAPAPQQRTVYVYTCCTAGDVQQVLVPGQPMSLRWITQRVVADTTPTTRYVVLSAELTGPYSDVGSLKSGGPARRWVAASPLRVDTWQSEHPISTMALPGGLAFGPLRPQHQD